MAFVDRNKYKKYQKKQQFIEQYEWFVFGVNNERWSFIYNKKIQEDNEVEALLGVCGDHVQVLFGYFRGLFHLFKVSFHGCSVFTVKYVYHIWVYIQSMFSILADMKALWFLKNTMQKKSAYSDLKLLNSQWSLLFQCTAVKEMRVYRPIYQYWNFLHRNIGISPKQIAFQSGSKHKST